MITVVELVCLCYGRLIGIVTTRQVGIECHVAAELSTSSISLESFVSNVNDAVRRCSDSATNALTGCGQTKIGKLY